MDLNTAIATLETLLAELKSAAAQAPQPQSPPAVHDDVLTAAQLAQRLQISTSYIYRHLKGLDPIPHHRFGRTIRFRLAEVQEWMVTRRIVDKLK
jgi:excisionase family DNA binding protein